MNFQLSESEQRILIYVLVGLAMVYVLGISPWIIFAIGVALLMKRGGCRMSRHSDGADEVGKRKNSDIY